MRQRGLLTVFAAIVLSLALPGEMLLGCVAGPADPAMDQMACCRNGHHECGRSMSAANCCERTDHSTQQGFAKAFTSFELLRKLPAATAIVARADAPQPALITSISTVVLFAGTTSPPRFAFSVLLI